MSNGSPLFVSMLLLWFLLLVSAGSHLSVDECKASSVSPAFHVISSSKPLTNITMADQVTFLVSRTTASNKRNQQDPTSICSAQVLGLAQEWMPILSDKTTNERSNSIDSKASVQRYIQDREQSIYARLLSVAKQYGTDQNDGDPQYAFYRVFKSADPRIEQVDSNTIPKQLAELLQGVELYKFTWAPQRSADYELSVRVDFENCTSSLAALLASTTKLGSSMHFCSPTSIEAVKLPIIKVQYNDDLQNSRFNNPSSKCDLSDLSSGHWFYKPKGPRPDSITDVYQQYVLTGIGPMFFPDSCPSFNDRLAKAKFADQKPSFCLVTTPHLKRLCKILGKEDSTTSQLVGPNASHNCHALEKQEIALAALEPAEAYIPAVQECQGSEKNSKSHSSIVVALMPHTHITSHEESLSKSAKLTEKDQKLLIVPSLAADPSKITTGSPLYENNHLKSALLMSPYFQRSQNELIVEALKKDGVKDHIFLDALSPSFMIDDIGHTMDDPWHYDGDAKWIYEWLLSLIAVGIDCEEKKDC